DRGREIFQADDAVDETIGLGWIMRGPQLENELVFLAEIDRLLMPALGQIPEMQAPAILAAQQYLRDQAVLERVRRAPFARDHGVIAKMPPRVVGKLLRSAIHLPAAERLEALVVHHENAAGRLAVFVAECRHIDPARAAVG